MKENFTCPKCEQPMTKGYTRAPFGIQWRGENDKPLRWNPIWKALSHTLHWWTFRENKAWQCLHCHVVTIDCSESYPSGRK